MKQLASIRSNTRFIVNYEEQELEPEFELILLTWKPEYIEDNGMLSKKSGFDETRISMNQKALNQLIAELKQLSKGTSGYAQMAEDINTIIRECREEDL